MYEREVKELAGLWDSNAKVRTNQILTQLQRELENLSIYNPIIEQVDLRKFFGNNIKALSQYLQLVNLVTLLHQHNQDVQITKTKKIIEVKAEYMIYVLHLFRSVWLKKDDELQFNARSTFNRLKKYLQEQDKTDYKSKIFQLKEVRKALNKAPVTMQRHLKTLELYGKIERCGGNNKTGYQYQIIEWNEQYSKVEAFEELIKNLSLP